jgi:hypothetical protein
VIAQVAAINDIKILNTNKTMEEIIYFLLFDEQVPDYEFCREASEWMM